MNGTRPLNYTTKIPADQTAGECMALLARSGASAVSVEYDKEARPAGLGFRLDTPHGRRDFSLPVNTDGIQRVLVKANQQGRLRSDGHKSASFESREHAANVAWRVAKDWLEAVLALIAAGMAQLDEVMLPFLHVGEDRTLWQAYRERESALELEPGSPR